MLVQLAGWDESVGGGRLWCAVSALMFALMFVGWRRGDLNPQPPPCKGDALPIEPRPHRLLILGSGMGFRPEELQNCYQGWSGICEQNLFSRRSNGTQPHVAFCVDVEV